jgi:hypothetical protein
MEVLALVHLDYNFDMAFTGSGNVHCPVGVRIDSLIGGETRQKEILEELTE